MLKYTRDNLRKLSTVQLAKLAEDDFGATIPLSAKDRMIREILALHTAACDALDRAEAEADAIATAEIEVEEPLEPLGAIPLPEPAAPVAPPANLKPTFKSAVIFVSIHHRAYRFRVSPMFYATFGAPVDAWGSAMLPVDAQGLFLPTWGVHTHLGDMESEVLVPKVRLSADGTTIIRRGNPGRPRKAGSTPRRAAVVADPIPKLASF